jgi:hypothetical protein
MCSAEYREGFTRCSDCGIDLVFDLPLEQEAEYVDLVTVFEGDSNSASVVSTALTNAGIESRVNNEGIQGIFPSLGPAEILVSAKDEEAAWKALTTLEP